jgi:hypothetical protein
MLNVLADGIPEGDELLARLLRDPELGPVVLLAQTRDHEPDEVSPEEAAWLMAGSILELLEIAGPDTVRAQLEELPRPQRVDVVRAIRDSSYPARETLGEFRVLVAEPVLRRRAGCAQPGAPPCGIPGRTNAAVRRAEMDDMPAQ